MSDRGLLAPALSKSVITCDMEGRIETFNEVAERYFGYEVDEIIGKKRVSLFSPGLVVLGHVGTWLETAVDRGKFETRTVFDRKDGTQFAADIRITPTFKRVAGEKVQIGFCGVTEALPDIPPAEAMPSISWATRLFKWLVVMRAPFLTATIVPVLLAGAWVGAGFGAEAFSLSHFLFALCGAMALHVAVNTFNDYFDWKSGTDQANTDYFMPFSGGSRAIELRLIDEGGLLSVALTALLISALCGLPLLMDRGVELLGFGLVGAFAAFFYTAPPIRLAARKGLGELCVGLCFGPLMVAGTVFAVTGHWGWMELLLGLPVGLLTAAILTINEFPDAVSDATTGKNHLVVVLGKKKARWSYVSMLFAAFAVTVAGVAFQWFPKGALVMLLALPMAWKAGRILFVHWADRELVTANVTTIQLQLLGGLLMAAGIFWNDVLMGMF